MTDAMPSTAPRPFVIAIDLEPDLRQPDPSARAPWLGFERLAPVMEAFRARVAAATGRPVRFAWYWRADPQVEAIYGDPAWALRRYAGEIAAHRAAGDTIGLHVHANRRVPSEPGGWRIDHGDRDWLEHCVRSSFVAFAAALGQPCRSFRFGDGWHADWLFDLLAELGVETELTIEPGWPPRPTILAGEPYAGSLPDTRGRPTAPWRWRGNLPWMMPVATTTRPGELRLRQPHRLLGRLARRLVRTWPGLAESLLPRIAPGRLTAPSPTQLIWGQEPAAFDRQLDRLERDPAFPVIVSVMRSDVGTVAPQADFFRESLARFVARAAAGPFALVTPGEAAAALALSERATAA